MTINPAQWTVSVTASPSGWGTVSGGGTFSDGDPCTVQATPNSDHTFINWTEGGTPVSVSASYTFTVTGNRTLVANFRVKRIYWDGTEYVPINSGFTGDSNTSRDKVGPSSGYLHLKAQGYLVTTRQIAWSTDVPVDLTGISRIGIQWRNTSSDSENESYLIAGSGAGDREEEGAQDAKLGITGSFGTRIDYLNVSGLNQSRYIRVHARGIYDWIGYTS